jgi:hypothetical protein
MMVMSDDIDWVSNCRKQDLTPNATNRNKIEQLEGEILTIHRVNKLMNGTI